MVKASDGLLIRPERAEDLEAIRAINAVAFGGHGEARLVDDLRRDGDLVLSWLAELHGEPVAHLAMSRLRPEPEIRAVSLAPVAVLPAFQRRGVGTALIRRALSELRSGGEQVVIVLGDPLFYRRFGFSAELAARLRTPYDGPHLQALALAGPIPDGRLRYPPAFAALA